MKNSFGGRGRDSDDSDEGQGKRSTAPDIRVFFTDKKAFGEALHARPPKALMDRTYFTKPYFHCMVP